MIKVNLKSPQLPQLVPIQFDPSSIGTIAALKQFIAQKTDTLLLGMKILYKGTPLKDQKDVSTVGLAENDTLHAVLKKKPAQSQPKAPQIPQSQSKIKQPIKNSKMKGDDLSYDSAFEKIMGSGPKKKPKDSAVGMTPEQMREELLKMNSLMITQVIQSDPKLKQMCDAKLSVKHKLLSKSGIAQILTLENVKSAMNKMGGQSQSGLLDFLDGGISDAYVHEKPQTGDPKTIYKEQLQQLHKMGFTDENKNIEALSQCKGNMENTISRILSN